MLSPATRINIPCFSHIAPKYAPIPVHHIQTLSNNMIPILMETFHNTTYIPHSGGNGLLGDLLSVNSVPKTNPVPLICKKHRPNELTRPNVL